MATTTNTTIERALISVSDKTHIVDLAKFLHANGVKIISTGGSADLLRKNGIPIQEVADYTGFPEIMSGRLKTLHPKIHGGILGRRDTDIDTMITHDIPDIDLVIVNLYPFEETIKHPDCTFEQAIENIDIGGPTMIRAAAKNHQWATVVTSPHDYAQLKQELHEHNGATTEKYRLMQATKAFSYTAHYEQIISNYLSNLSNLPGTLFPEYFHPEFIKQSELRYGENPHQPAAVYINKSSPGLTSPLSSITQAIQHQGKPLSFNNIMDADCALEAILSLGKPESNQISAACVIVKHANPCGAAIGENNINAYQKAFSCDPLSSFGGVIALNTPIDTACMQVLINNQFIEVLIAPNFTPEALQIASQKPNIRLLSLDFIYTPPQDQYDLKKIRGGLLIQACDYINNINIDIVSKKQPTPEQLQDLHFAWKIVKSVKSNAIVYAKHKQTIGIGAGQMSRVFSAEIGLLKAAEAKLSTQDAVMASDAFFPFTDSLDVAIKAGITAVIQPGGSIRDQDIIDFANAHNIILIFTHQRHFKH